MMIEVYTDGACSGNPGPGGWGVVIRAGSSDRELMGGEADTTNNRMEMQAVIRACAEMTDGTEIALYTDSSYVKDGITRWIAGWKRNGWRTSQKKAVKNQDLWRRIDAEAARLRISWHWVKGHADNPWNNRADALARQGLLQAALAGETP